MAIWSNHCYLPVMRSNWGVFCTQFHDCNRHVGVVTTGGVSMHGCFPFDSAGWTLWITNKRHIPNFIAVRMVVIFIVGCHLNM